MKILKKIILSGNILFVFTSIQVVAQNNTTNIATPASVTATNAQPQNLFFCPAPNQLVKDSVHMTWSTPDHQWKSYGISFENNLTQFWGAQWTGTIIGQITCIYHADEKTTFPVMLVYHALTLEPHSGKWGPNLGGYRNCLSHSIPDCSFQVRVRPATEDIYEQAGNIKPDNDLSDQTPNF